MKLRAVIFDVYGTLLEVGLPPLDADERWLALWKRTLGGLPRLGLREFGAVCDKLIGQEHATARARGVAHPEVFWPAIATKALPELAGLASETQDEFFFCQARLWHTVRLMPGAANALRQLQQGPALLGFASNSQPYTLRELDEEFARAGLNRSRFHPALCFWSFEHGFSKPDAEVFRLLAKRLSTLGVTPAETLVVGDRLDNDIQPARAQGFHTWHMVQETAGLAGGPWNDLHRQLREQFDSKRGDESQLPG